MGKTTGIENLGRGIAFAAQYSLASDEWSGHFHSTGKGQCQCGASFRNNIGLGLHRAAAMKKADRRQNDLIYDSIDGKEATAWSA